MKNNKGFGVMEIIVGVAVISISFFALMRLAATSVDVLETNTKNIKAAFLLEEGAEVVKILRDNSWTNNIANLNVSADYFLDFDGTTWKATTTNIKIDNFYERKFVLENVYRNGSDVISELGVLDPNTKKVTVYVSWQGIKGLITKSISLYIANIF